MAPSAHFVRPARPLEPPEDATRSDRQSRLAARQNKLQTLPAAPSLVAGHHCWPSAQLTGPAHPLLPWALPASPVHCLCPLRSCARVTRQPNPSTQLTVSIHWLLPPTPLATLPHAHFDRCKMQTTPTISHFLLCLMTLRRPLFAKCCDQSFPNNFNLHEFVLEFLVSSRHLTGI